MKNKAKASSTQPEWVCNECGEKYGTWYQGGDYSGPKHLMSTTHEDMCDVCHKISVCTEARDYGYLTKAWLTADRKKL